MNTYTRMFYFEPGFELTDNELADIQEQIFDEAEERFGKGAVDIIDWRLIMTIAATISISDKTEKEVEK